MSFWPSSRSSSGRTPAQSALSQRIGEEDETKTRPRDARIIEYDAIVKNETRTMHCPVTSEAQEHALRVYHPQIRVTDEKNVALCLLDPSKIMIFNASDGLWMTHAKWMSRFVGLRPPSAAAVKASAWITPGSPEHQEWMKEKGPTDEGAGANHSAVLRLY